MKINKKDPKHWAYFAKSGVYILLSIAIRPFFSKNKKPVVTLFGHKLNGNLKAFADYSQNKEEYKLQFVTIDPDYYHELKNSEPKNVEVLFLQKLNDVFKVAKSDAVISDRRAHALIYYLYLTRIPFVDVWHGIQMFKRFSPNQMSMLKRYHEIWTPSKAFVEVYVNDYGIDRSKVKVTGYARVDALIKDNYGPEIIRKKYGIDKKYRKIILLAPTWQQDDPSRKIIPFGEKPQKFLSALDSVAEKNNVLIIFRAHLNTNSKNQSGLSSMDNIRVMSHNEYPQAEEFLAITDLFIGDWSSIAFDYLPLGRPAIFLDVPVPFENGLTFEDEHRFGEIVSNLNDLTAAIDKYINNPKIFNKKYSKRMSHTKKIAYGDTLDGKSAERYHKRLQKILN